MTTARAMRLLLLPALLATPAPALDPGKLLTQYLHDVWQIEQGLPQNSARSIVQTRDGYLWFGSQEGLVRFDGVRFTVFDTVNAPGLLGQGVNSLHEDRDGTLWVATDGGVSRMKDGVFTPLPGITPLVIQVDRSGSAWIGTQFGLARLRGGRLETFTKEHGLPGVYVTAFLEDREGNLWIGTWDGGLVRWKDGRFHSIRKADGLASDCVNGLLEGRDGSLWVATDAGLDRLRGGTITRYSEKDGLPARLVQALLEDRDGTLWIATIPGGLSRLRDGVITTDAQPDGLAEERIVSLFEDREGSLFVGTSTGGLHRLRDGKLTPFTPREGLSANVTTALHEARDGSLFIGTVGGGVNRLKDGRVTVLSTAQGLTDDFVSSLAEAPDGALLVGTRLGGLCRLEDGRFTAVLPRAGVPGRSVRALLVDRSGTVWVGTGTEGLVRLSPDGRATTFTTRDGLSFDHILSLLEDRRGRLFVGTTRGLNVLEGGAFRPVGEKEGLGQASIFELDEDLDGTIWIGTLQAGLFRLEGGTLAQITARDGLFVGAVFSALDDGLGSLWLSGNRGIFQASKEQLAAFARGSVPRISLAAYGLEDGMKSPECNRLGRLRARDGRLWFATIRGVVVVDPARLPRNELPPPVVVEDVLTDGGPAGRASGAPLVFPPGTRALEVRFTALSFRVPRRVAFRYRLEGFDESWVEAGTRRTARYTNLPPRRYTFRVVAGNDDGVWNEAGASLPFELRPRFYETSWFRGLEVALGLALVGAALLVQRRRLESKRLVALHLADLKRKAQELELARQVQLAFLPKGPWRSGDFEVAGEMRTATEVGGDYYGTFRAGPSRFAVVIGDATGHGVAAGLVTGMAKAVLESLQRGRGAQGPEEWMDELNGALKASITRRSLGMCLGLAHVEEATGRVTLAVAGVPHSFLWRANGGGPKLERLVLNGPPLGYFSKVVPATGAATLAPGDRLVLITDGLIEQRNAAGEMWGYEGIEEALPALCARDVPPKQIAAGLLDACEAFASGRGFDDDRTVVVLERGAGANERTRTGGV